MTTQARPSPDPVDLAAQGRAKFQARRFREAEALFAEALRLAPEDPGAAVGLAVTIYEARRDASRALTLLDAACAHSPNHPSLHQTRAAMLSALGRFDEAVTAARRALDLNPRNALAMANIADAMKVPDGDPMLAKAEALTAANATPTDDRVVAHFALGKAYQDIGDWERAYSHIQRGNDLRGDQPDLEKQVQALTLLRTAFSAKACRVLRRAAVAGPRMIFIVGMPRSGTTLVERILVAHPDVSTAGERPDLATLFERLIQQAVRANPSRTPADALTRAMTTDNLTRLAEAYRGRVRPHADDLDAPVLVDKNPLNFWRVGAIAAVFPDAAILHTRRHPLDTAWSCFAQNFRGGVPFAGSQTALGLTYRRYSELMAHWRRVLPGRMHEIAYETLVADPDAGARRIVAAAGLDWHPDCAAPERSAGAIKTASRWQARQKVYRSSVEKWRRFEPWLGPMIDAMGGRDWVEAEAASQR